LPAHAQLRDRDQQVDEQGDHGARAHEQARTDDAAEGDHGHVAWLEAGFQLALSSLEWGAVRGGREIGMPEDGRLKSCQHWSL
jgi:hypothetical protein